MATFKCQRCGWCCMNTNIAISYSDIKRWEAAKQWWILAKVSFFDAGDKDRRSGFYFLSSVTKSKHGTEKNCPFFRKNPIPKCLIYETRPRACKDFPIVRSHFEMCKAARKKKLKKKTEVS